MVSGIIANAVGGMAHRARKILRGFDVISSRYLRSKPRKLLNLCCTQTVKRRTDSAKISLGFPSFMTIRTFWMFNSSHSAILFKTT